MQNPVLGSEIAQSVNPLTASSVNNNGMTHYSVVDTLLSSRHITQ